VTGADPTADAAVASYLARLDAALAAVPPGDRREILLETRSHVVERLGRSPWRGADAVLAELGAPEAYARQFLGDDDGAPAPPAPPAPPGATQGSATLFALAQLTTRGGRALPWLLLFGALYVVAGVALLFVIGDVFFPTGTGVFVQPPSAASPHVWVVIAEAGAPGADLLGRAIIPIGLLVAAAIHLAARGLLARLVGREARPAPALTATDGAPTHSVAGSVTLLGLARLGQGGWQRVPLLLLVLTGYGIAGWGLLLVISEVVDPAGTGFIVRRIPDDRWQVGFMMSGTPGPGEDVLGFWFAAAIHLAVRALLRRLIRADAARA
jgi:uncharacterized membrane protein